MEVYIIKRDGKRELFSAEKIKDAIAKAFLSVGSFATRKCWAILCAGYIFTMEFLWKKFRIR